MGQFGVLLRNTCFGSAAILFNNANLNSDEYFTARILTDCSISYAMKAWLNITAGANNLCNVYPGRLQDYRNSTEGMLIFSQEATPFGFYGGYYFLGMNFNL